MEYMDGGRNQWFYDIKLTKLWLNNNFLGALTDIVTITEMDESQIAAIGYESLLGLDYLHSNKIIHNPARFVKRELFWKFSNQRVAQKF